MTRPAVGSLVPIPGLSADDVAVLPGLLESHGFAVKVETSIGEVPLGSVFVLQSDVPKIKQLLAKYRVRGGAGGSLGEIPW
jgi:hypothetical protein